MNTLMFYIMIKNVFFLLFFCRNTEPHKKYPIPFKSFSVC